VSPALTRRQEIIQCLRDQEWVFDDLRHELAIKVSTLEDDLGHIERSVRSNGDRLRVRSAICADCGFELSNKALHPPGRCPNCKSRDLDGPWLSIAEF
jgi:predicted Zn-ribbon and HTH transcriptional regulator